MYEHLWELDGEQRLKAIEDLPLFATDDIHRIARKNCLRCPLAILYVGEDGLNHTCCVDVSSYVKVKKLLSSGGKFIKKGEF